MTYGNTKGYVYPGPNVTPYTVQITSSDLQLGLAEERTVSAQVLGPNGQPISDPENVNLVQWTTASLLGCCSLGDPRLLYRA